MCCVLTTKTLIDRYRFPRAMILQLAEQLRPALERPTRRRGALPVVVQLTSALRLFAKGDFQREVADMAEMSQPAIYFNMTKGLTAISRLAPQYIVFPKAEEITENKTALYRECRVPGVIGLVDGSLFPIKAPNGRVEAA